MNQLIKIIAIFIGITVLHKTIIVPESLMNKETTIQLFNLLNHNATPVKQLGSLHFYTITHKLNTHTNNVLL